MVWRPMSVQRRGLRGGDQCTGISANELTSGANLDHDSTPLFLPGNNVYGTRFTLVQRRRNTYQKTTGCELFRLNLTTFEDYDVEATGLTL
jgi:hypothetical protein